MNTRKYPRTTLEAFGCDARSACAIERERPIYNYITVGCIIGIVLTLAAVAAGWI